MIPTTLMFEGNRQRSANTNMTQLLQNTCRGIRRDPWSPTPATDTAHDDDDEDDDDDMIIKTS